MNTFNRRCWMGSALLTAVSYGFVSSNAEEPAKAPEAKWPPMGYAKVVVYHFQTEKNHVQIWNKDGLDEEALKKCTVKSAELSKSQIDDFLKAGLSDADEPPTYRCYDPHHVFVFRDKDDHFMGALEICFHCFGSRYSPARPEGKRPDYPALAKLCEKLVGMEDGVTAAAISKRLGDGN